MELRSNKWVLVAMIFVLNIGIGCSSKDSINLGQPNQPERDRSNQEQAERIRLAREETERIRLAREEAERIRLAREEAERSRLAREQTERTRLAREEAERNRLTREQTERARLARDQAERARLAREEAERSRLAREQTERTRLAQEQLERTRLSRLLVSQSADEFIQNAQPLVVGRAQKIRIAQMIESHIAVFFNLNPSLAQAIQLIRQNGGLESQELIDFSIFLKHEILQRHRVSGANEYVQVMGEIFPRAFQNQNYKEQNALTIVDSLGSPNDPVLLHDGNTIQDLKQLRTMIRAALAGNEFQAHLDQIVQLINSAILRLHLKNKVLQKFQQDQPNLNDSIKFYLIRDPSTWGSQLAFRDLHGECSVCTASDRIYQGIDTCRDCLIAHIRTKMADRRYPIQSTNSGDELPLSRAFLQEAGFTLREILTWENGTLAAYYTRLDLNPNILRDCPLPGCNGRVFQSDADGEHHVRCEVCDHEYCFNCNLNSSNLDSNENLGHDRVHHGFTCQQANLIQWVAPPESQLRPCPYCHQLMERSAGCNVMVCPYCHAKFNFVLGKFRWADQTRTQRHSGGDNYYEGSRQYLIPGEPGYVSGRESAYSGNGPVFTLEEAVQAGMRDQHRF